MMMQYICLLLGRPTLSMLTTLPTMTKKRVLLQTFENLKARAIKNILLALVIMGCFNCESIQTKPKNEFNLKDRIKKGKSILITDKEFNSTIDFTEITEQILINENILQVNI